MRATGRAGGGVTVEEIVRLAIREQAAQKAAELHGLVELVVDLAPRTVVEIGTMKGGTLAAWCACAADDALLVSVDLPGGRWGGENVPHGHEAHLRSLTQPGQTLHLIRGDSHDRDIRLDVFNIVWPGSIDFLFIDGDHTLDGVRQDFEDYARYVRKGGLVALHDILPHPQVPGCDVDQFWAEIKDGYPERWEFCVDGDERGYGPWGGIGVIRWPG